MDPATVIEEARTRLIEDTALLPAGHEYLGGSVDVELGQASLPDGVLTVRASVTARSVGRIDLDEVRSRIAGRSVEAAEAALADLGTVSVDLWPAWAATVPELEWRVEIRVVDMPEAAT